MKLTRYSTCANQDFFTGKGGPMDNCFCQGVEARPSLVILSCEFNEFEFLWEKVGSQICS